MKRSFLNITLASIITLVAYIALSAVLKAILIDIDILALRLFVGALLTAVAFGFFLLYTSKMRKSVGTNEVLSDYKSREYISFADDFKLLIRHESKTIICIVLIVLICFALNTLDRILFENKTISLPTFFFAPMCLFDTVISVPFLGYAVSAAADCISYILFLLIYRRRKYNYWMKKRK